jgi:hypothetical protein
MNNSSVIYTIVNIIGVLVGIAGVIISIYYARRSRNVENAFTRYVEYDNEIKRLKLSSPKKTESEERIQLLEEIKTDTYRNKYQPIQVNLNCFTI